MSPRTIPPTGLLPNTTGGFVPGRTIRAVAQVALEHDAEAARRDERLAFHVAKSAAPRAQVHGLPVAAVGQGEVVRRQMLGSSIRVARVILAEQPVRPPHLLDAALVLLFARAVIAVDVQSS